MPPEGFGLGKKERKKKEKLPSDSCTAKSIKCIVMAIDKADL